MIAFIVTDIRVDIRCHPYIGIPLIRIKVGKRGLQIYFAACYPEINSYTIFVNFFKGGNLIGATCSLAFFAISDSL